MEIVDPSEAAKHHHAWLEWLGLQEPPPEADSWVPVARGFRPDTGEGRSSRLAAQMIDALTVGGVEGRQRLYQFYEIEPGMVLPGTGMETCVAVMVHNRDLTHAVELATGVAGELAEEANEPESGAISNDELARQALEAGPPPPD